MSYSWSFNCRISAEDAADSFEKSDFGFSLPRFRSLVFISPAIPSFRYRFRHAYILVRLYPIFADINCTSFPSSKQAFIADNFKATPHNNIQRDKLSILGINALVFFAIGTAIAAKNCLFLPQNCLRFSLDDIVRYCLNSAEGCLGCSAVFIPWKDFRLPFGLFLFAIQVYIACLDGYPNRLITSAMDLVLSYRPNAFSFSFFVYILPLQDCLPVQVFVRTAECKIKCVS